MKYPVAVNLPFNRASVEGCFQRTDPSENAPVGNPWYAILKGASLVVEKSGDQLLLPRELPGSVDAEGLNPIYIGLWHGEPLYAIRVKKDTEIPPPLVAEPFNSNEERLDEKLLTIGGVAQQILYWESISSVCARCGGEMGAMAGSWGKKCLNCCHERFPAVHPCSIILVRRENEFLLVRKPEWGAGRFSLVAGFLDFSESLEECAAREVKEETGVDICNIRYVGSQAWPFPSQVMAGFVADYAGGEIAVDRKEIEEAGWFSRDNLPAPFPPHRSIARWIIENYAIPEIGV